jgi:hypothetical protein
MKMKELWVEVSPKNITFFYQRIYATCAGVGFSVGAFMHRVRKKC